MAAAYGHYVSTKYRMTQNFVNAVRPEHELNYCAAYHRNFVNIGMFAEALFDVRRLNPFNRRTRG